MAAPDETCDLRAFRYQSVSQPTLEGGSTSNQINEQSMELFLEQFKAAVCADIQYIIDNCCDGGTPVDPGVTEFTALSDTPSSYVGEGGNAVIVNAGATALEFGTPAAGSDADGVTLDYSTTEQATDRLDEAGATIYQKTILNAGNLATGTVNIAHGITTLANVVAWRGWADRSNGSQLPLPFPSGGSTFVVSLQINATNLILGVGTGWTGAGLVLSNARMTIFYTKV
tara:strand:- start:8864 stop:9547 length:684 start_codon:yes stop_codon:yes gene_type:complete